MATQKTRTFCKRYISIRFGLHGQNMNQKILELLYKVFREYAGHLEPNENSQLCIMWALNDPPDVLDCTAQIGSIEEAFDISLSEDDAVELFDMSLLEASLYIQKILENNLNSSD